MTLYPCVVRTEKFARILNVKGLKIKRIHSFIHWTTRPSFNLTPLYNVRAVYSVYVTIIGTLKYDVLDSYGTYPPVCKFMIR